MLETVFGVVVLCIVAAAIVSATGRRTMPMMEGLAAGAMALVLAFGALAPSLAGYDPRAPGWLDAVGATISGAVSVFIGVVWYRFAKLDKRADARRRR
jgi:hypothetical protein